MFSSQLLTVNVNLNYYKLHIARVNQAKENREIAFDEEEHSNRHGGDSVDYEDFGMGSGATGNGKVTILFHSINQPPKGIKGGAAGNAIFNGGAKSSLVGSNQGKGVQSSLNTNGSSSGANTGVKTSQNFNQSSNEIPDRRKKYLQSQIYNLTFSGIEDTNNTEEEQQ